MYLKMHRLQRFACKRATVALVITLFLTTLLLSSQRVLSFQVPLPIRQSVQRRHHHHQQHRHVAAAGQPSNTKAISVGGLWGNDMLQKSGCSASFPSSSSLQSRIQRNDRKKRRLSSRLFTFNNNQDINDDEMDDDNDDDGRDLVPAAAMTVDPIVKETSRQLKRISWFSWWAQVILSTISTTILIFAASVLRRSSAGNLLAPSPPFLLSGLSLILSATSVVWTWGNGTRLSRRLLRNNSKNKSSSSRDKGLVVSSSSPRATARITAANLLRRAVRIQVTINLLGLFLTILAAEQIVGSLAIKVLTTFVGGAGGGGVGIMPYGSAAGAAAAFVQPLDILVVQANTNTLLSHFVSLATSLFLTNQIRTLDPPNH